MQSSWSPSWTESRCEQWKADAHHKVVADADEETHKQVQETVILARATQECLDLCVTNWVTTQQEDLILKTMIE